MFLVGGSREPALEPEPFSNLSFRDNSNRGRQTYTASTHATAPQQFMGADTASASAALPSALTDAPLSRDGPFKRTKRPQSHRFRAEAEADKHSTIFYYHYPWFEVRKCPTRSSATLGPDDMLVLPRPWLVSGHRRAAAAQSSPRLSNCLFAMSDVYSVEASLSMEIVFWIFPI